MDLKERILEAAFYEFNEKSIKFTMDDVAKRLGISKRTLYEIVKDKEALFDEAIDYVFGAIKEGEKKIEQDTGLDIVEKLKMILSVLPEKYKTIDFRKLYDVKVRYPKIYSKIENGLESQWEGTYAIIEQAMEEGRIKKINLSVFKAMYSGTIEYYFNRNVLDESGITYEEALTQMLDIMLEGIVI